MIAMDGQGFNDHKIHDTRMTVQKLLEFVQTSKLATLVIISLLKSPPAEGLQGRDLMVWRDALFMISIPCGPVTMTRMDSFRENCGATWHVMIVPAKEENG